MRQNHWRWLAGAFLLFMLAVAIAADRGSMPVWVRNIYRYPGGDWLGHFILYGILAFLGIRAFSRQVSMAGRSFPLSALLVILLAALEELSQFWFPLRTPSLYDLAFGLSGVVCAAWLTRLSR